MPKCYPQLRDRTWMTQAYRTQTMAQIAEHVGCSVAGVLNSLQRHGIDRRPSQSAPRVPRIHDDDWLREVYKTHTTRQIAKAIGCSQPAVWRRVVALGLPRHPQKRQVARPKSKYWCRLREDGSIVRTSRHVIELELGRRLKANEHVHHIDGNTLNNERSNLQLMTAEEHGRHHAPEFVGRVRKIGFTSYRRLCVGCGTTFLGGNRAKWCPACKPVQ